MNIREGFRKTNKMIVDEIARIIRLIVMPEVLFKAAFVVGVVVAFALWVTLLVNILYWNEPSTVVGVLGLATGYAVLTGMVISYIIAVVKNSNLSETKQKPSPGDDGRDNDFGG